LVSACEKQNKSLTQLTLDEFKQYSSAIEEDVYDDLGAANVARQYSTEGAGGTKQAKKQVEFWEKYLHKR
jgi:argininosuccinate lyase